MGGIDWAAERVERVEVSLTVQEVRASHAALAAFAAEFPGERNVARVAALLGAVLAEYEATRGAR